MSPFFSNECVTPMNDDPSRSGHARQTGIPSGAAASRAAETCTTPSASNVAQNAQNPSGSASRPLRDIDELTESERRGEIAGILARGIIRLHATGAISGHTARTSPESSQTGLDLSQAARPHRSHAVNADENPAPGTTSENGGDA